MYIKTQNMLNKIVKTNNLYIHIGRKLDSLEIYYRNRYIDIIILQLKFYYLYI